MKWRGSYRGGEIELEAQTRGELDKQLDEIHPSGTKSDLVASTILEIPKLSGNIGCSDAIRQALGSEWGQLEPRTMAELQQAFQANALYFGSGTLSGTLNYLTKSGAIRRMEKSGKWAYILVSKNAKD